MNVSYSRPRRALPRTGGVLFEGGVWVAVLLVLAASVFAIAVVIRQIDHHYSRNVCYRWGEQTGREVRFVDLSFWSYPCLVKTSEGTWLDKDQLREIDG